VFAHGLLEQVLGALDLSRRSDDRDDPLVRAGVRFADRDVTS